MNALLSGNEAIARGAWEAGVVVAAGYPGTPSTEILETLAGLPEVKAQWSPNEKVAVEVAYGAALAGRRALAAMKHVGVNVAADPLLSAAYTGVTAGLVVVSADDPGLHSSQNEQDNRHYARLAKIPCVEPSDSQEAKDFTALAFALSEEFDTPVLLRITTRISHSKAKVELGERKQPILMNYGKEPTKTVLIPAHARLRHSVVEARLLDLADYAERTPLNRVEWRDKTLGVVTSGVAYQYVREALPEASILKLGLTYPLPARRLVEFAAEVGTLWVVEELDPFLEEQIRALGLACRGKDVLPREGEFSPDTLRQAILGVGPSVRLDPETLTLPQRPPVLCPGCPHRGVFYALKQLNLTVAGDIGCYSLGALPPLEAMDTCLSMGAAIGTAVGMVKANPELAGRVVAVLGDSTFLHSGMTGLLDAVYNKAPVPVLILDNQTTAMTGHQDHPGTGRTLQGQETSAVDYVALVKALGVNRVSVVDPLNLDKLKQTLREELAAGEPSVIIARRACALRSRKPAIPLAVDPAACTACRSCLRLGCPAITAAGCQVSIDPAQCTGCGLCVRVCKANAIGKAGMASA
ncbi:MAG TPA: indolepyruvate ferredoxin oxidoreductase subunit alpha [Firmicutes bacterium]|nr:indolepyruvate ferredoxin oxidoreductase subunit alpha [Bacillota bacterium]